jgi:predicted RNA-binding Zn ribbon-like protein
MAFAHDTQYALESGVYLANTALEPDTLTSLGDLCEFFDTFGYTGKRPVESDLEPTRAIRRTLHDLFVSTRDGAVPQVNAILASARALPQLVRHGDVDWHIHATTDDRPLAERILVETAMAMIDMIRADEMSRFDRCANDDCEGIVLDLSRNRSRLYCSTACTNRAAAAAYRARQSADD